MQHKKNKLDLDLEFKTLSDEDIEPKLKFHPLTPREYLNFLEASFKCLPDLASAKKRNMAIHPRVKFTL